MSTGPEPELAATLLICALALATRPWRLLKAPAAPVGGVQSGNPLWTPLLAALVLLPVLWALPRIHAMPLQLQWSGACLVLLMLGWPLAVLVFAAAGLGSALLAPTPVAASAAGALAELPPNWFEHAQAAWPLGVELALWLGIAPATFALLIGAALRRLAGTHPFIYILGRGFFGTVLSLFAAGALAQWAGHEIAYTNHNLSMVARWLMAWGDGFITGMLTAIFVAFKPQWLATWSDALYLKK